jgi:predicted KAP-like P-loop ATPase
MDRLEDWNTADVPLGEIEKRRRVMQGLADGK